MELQALETPVMKEQGQQASQEDEKEEEEDLTAKTKYGQPTMKIQFSVLGITLAVLSSFSASVMTMFVKLSRSVPTFEVVWYRTIVVFVFISPHLIYYKVPIWSYSKRNLFFLFARSITGAVAVPCKFYGVKHLPIADATVINFTTPVFAAIFGYIFLKESLHILDGVAAVFSLGGILLIARPSFIFGSTSGRDFELVWLPVMACLLAAILTALSFIAIRKLGQIQPTAVLFHFTVTMFMSSLIGSLADGNIQLPQCDTNENWYLLLVGITSIFVQIFVTKALSLEKAMICSLARTSDIVFAFIWQVTIFSVHPSPYSIGGAILITMCNLLIFTRKYVMAKRQLALLKSN